MKKKHKNMLLLILLLLCISVVFRDFYVIAIQPWITHKSAGWTWFGFITFIAAFKSSLNITSYFVEKL